MSEIVSIDANSDCSQTGGVEKAYAVPFSEVTAVTVTSGVITGFTMAQVGQWGKLVFDDDNNVAFYHESAEQQGNQTVFTGEGLMKFSGITQAKITAANKAKDCCGLVIVWVHYDGTRRVQGIDVAPDNSWTFSTNKARILPNVLSDTSENESRVEYNTTHRGKYASPTTDLDDAAIEAL